METLWDHIYGTFFLPNNGRKMWVIIQNLKTVLVLICDLILKLIKVINFVNLVSHLEYSLM